MATIDLLIKRKPSILVVGDLMLDKFIFGDVERISPEAPVPVVKFKKEKSMLGGSGNVLRNLYNLNVIPSILSALGDDVIGDKILALLKGKKISTESIIKVPNNLTTEKMRIVGNGQQVLRVDWDNSDFSFNDYENIIKNIIGAVDNCDGIIISDYNKGVCTKEVVKQVIQVAKSYDKPVFIDPKGLDWEKYSGASIITPNTKEVEAFLGHRLSTDMQFLEAGKYICSNFNIDTCLITRGAKGMSLFNKNVSLHLPSEAKEIFDVSGAGDTVIASLSASILAGADLLESVEFANQAAGIVVGHIGTSAITIDELKRVYE